ncbi:hypothetical protein BKA63DRAFT_238563 [Paraphoma chrysanthemicola]|nr:hypothetical protein BKA63DRAFT_238563 [Paraphoma chrysanthemicola]
MAGTPHRHVDLESDKDLSSKAFGELRLTSSSKSLERLWLSEVIDRTADAFLYRWNSEHQRWLQYRWDAACAIYYSRLHIDDQRWKYLDWNGAVLGSVTTKVLASSQANAAEFVGPSETVFNGSLMGNEERRRIQNRIAQRNYRKRLRARLFELEEKANVNPQTGHDAVVVYHSAEHKEQIDPEVMVYQDADEPVRMSCICESSSDQRFIIACLQCGTWQHIACYYESAKDYMDEHRCVQCAPRLIEPKLPSAKRSANVAFSVYSSSTEYRSKRQARTLGAQSSIGQHGRAGSETAYTEPTVDNNHELHHSRSILSKEHEWPVVKKSLAISTRTGQACDRCKIRKIRCDTRPEGCTPCEQNDALCRITDRITGHVLVCGHAATASLTDIFDARERERVKEAGSKDGNKWTDFFMECPLSAFKTDLNLSNTCADLQAKNISQIRTHLLKSHGIDTEHYIVCGRDVMDASLLDLYHGFNCEDPLPHATGIIGSRQQWKELYMSLRRMMNTTREEKEVSGNSLMWLAGVGLSVIRCCPIGSRPSSHVLTPTPDGGSS